MIFPQRTAPITISHLPLSVNLPLTLKHHPLITWPHQNPLSHEPLRHEPIILCASSHHRATIQASATSTCTAPRADPAPPAHEQRRPLPLRPADPVLHLKHNPKPSAHALSQSMASRLSHSPCSRPWPTSRGLLPSIIRHPNTFITTQGHLQAISCHPCEPMPLPLFHQALSHHPHQSFKPPPCYRPAHPCPINRPSLSLHGRCRVTPRRAFAQAAEPSSKSPPAVFRFTDPTPAILHPREHRSRASRPMQIHVRASIPLCFGLPLHAPLHAAMTRPCGLLPHNLSAARSAAPANRAAILLQTQRNPMSLSPRRCASPWPALIHGEPVPADLNRRAEAEDGTP